MSSIATAHYASFNMIATYMISILICFAIIIAVQINDHWRNIIYYPVILPILFFNRVHHMRHAICPPFLVYMLKTIMDMSPHIFEFEWRVPPTPTLLGLNCSDMGVIAAYRVQHFETSHRLCTGDGVFSLIILYNWGFSALSSYTAGL